MGNLAVAYVVICEWLLAGFFGLCGLLGIMGFVASWRESKFLLIGLFCFLISGAVGYTGLALGQQKTWGLRASWGVGASTVVLASWTVWTAMQPNQYNDSGYVWLLGIAMLIFALPAMILLALPSSRRYVRGKRQKTELC